MQIDYEKLLATPLFRGVTLEEAEHMIQCLDVKRVHYKKEEIIYHEGDSITTVGIVLSGSVLIENNDIWGNRSILDRVGEGQIFAETYACVPGEKLLVNVLAAEASDILFLEVSKMLKGCTNVCSRRSKLIRNLLTVTAKKNLKLSHRIFNTSSKSIRGRLLSYLSYQAMENGSREFEIPFNRQQLADYLSVDRSAMSNELGKMQRDGLIRVEKNHFWLTGATLTEFNTELP